MPFNTKPEAIPQKMNNICHSGLIEISISVGFVTTVPLQTMSPCNSETVSFPQDFTLQSRTLSLASSKSTRPGKTRVSKAPKIISMLAANAIQLEDAIR
jgi:hypothetical protein